MAIVLRFLLIPIAFFVSCMVAAFVVAYGLVGPELSEFKGSPEFFVFFLFLGSAAGIVTPFYVFGPSVVAILIAEMFSLRSVLYYALAGGMIGALAYFMTDVAARTQGAGTVAPIMQELQWLTAAGIIAGFVYWMIAGRGAGKWKGA